MTSSWQLAGVAHVECGVHTDGNDGAQCNAEQLHAGGLDGIARVQVTADSAASTEVRVSFPHMVQHK